MVKPVFINFSAVAWGLENGRSPNWRTKMSVLSTILKYTAQGWGGGSEGLTKTKEVREGERIRRICFCSRVVLFNWGANQWRRKLPAEERDSMIQMRSHVQKGEILDSLEEFDLSPRVVKKLRQGNECRCFIVLSRPAYFSANQKVISYGNPLQRVCLLPLSHIPEEVNY